MLSAFFTHVLIIIRTPIISGNVPLRQPEPFSWCCTWMHKNQWTGWQLNDYSMINSDIHQHLTINLYSTKKIPSAKSIVKGMNGPLVSLNRSVAGSCDRASRFASEKPPSCKNCNFCDLSKPKALESFYVDKFPSEKRSVSSTLMLLFVLRLFFWTACGLYRDRFPFFDISVVLLQFKSWKAIRRLHANYWLLEINRIL